jgi:hypothetical protein
MNLNKYIDNSIINEYADKDPNFGYSLDVTEIPKHEQSNFLEMIIEHDQIFREKILDRMQELINSRLSEVESLNKYWSKSA